MQSWVTIVVMCVELHLAGKALGAQAALEVTENVGIRGMLGSTVLMV